MEFRTGKFSFKGKGFLKNGMIYPGLGGSELLSLEGSTQKWKFVMLSIAGSRRWGEGGGVMVQKEWEPN